MCNIVTELVTEFYLYSIVYIYLMNSRLDVTHSVRHHFCTIQTLSTAIPEDTVCLDICISHFVIVPTDSGLNLLPRFQDACYNIM